ncbi:MAG: hypothetical protein IIU08_00100, partial [Clostridia bacterium]|nr:hypothetical protein [Clostridia bacterium]
ADLRVIVDCREHKHRLFPVRLYRPGGGFDFVRKRRKCKKSVKPEENARILHGFFFTRRGFCGIMKRISGGDETCRIPIRFFAGKESR